MDLFTKELRLSFTLADIMKHYMKLMEWMPLSPKDNFDYINIETLIKGCIFLYECNRIFGLTIVSNIADHEPSFAKYYASLIKNEYNDQQFITSLRYNILRTPNSLRNAVLLDNAFTYVEKLYTVTSIEHTPADLLKVTDIKYRKLDLLVNRIFQIPFTQIDRALNKVCCHIEFDILGLLFCSNSSGRTSAKYAILEYKLCQKLQSTNSNDFKYFLRSITTYLTKNVNGIYFYKKCIENKYFCQALCTLFHNFLNSLREKNESFEIHLPQNSEMFYLIKITLDAKCSSFHENFTNMSANITSLSNILTQLYAVFN